MSEIRINKFASVTGQLEKFDELKFIVDIFPSLQRYLNQLQQTKKRQPRLSFKSGIPWVSERAGKLAFTEPSMKGIAKQNEARTRDPGIDMPLSLFLLGQGCALPTELFCVYYVNLRFSTALVAWKYFFPLATTKFQPIDAKQKKDNRLVVFQERKTRLELATPTLARLCSTNWAISAFNFSFKWRRWDSNSHDPTVTTPSK